jgi:diguanylate cyclase (GGDEF)-like protein
MDTWPRPVITRIVLVACTAAFLLGAAAPQAVRSAAASLVDQAERVLRKDADQARNLSEHALKQIAQNPDADVEFRARLTLCDYFAGRDIAAALLQIDSMQALQPRLQRKGLGSRLLTCRGEVAETLGSSVEALTLYDRAVSAATSSADEEMLAGALYARGLLRSMRGDFAAGLTDLRRSQQFYDRNHLALQSMTTLNAVATAYSRMGDNTQALTIYRRALQTQRDAGLLGDQAVTEHSIGRVYEKLGHWDDAARSFDSSLTISRELHDLRGEGYALRGMAAVSLARGDARESLKLLANAATVQNRTPDTGLGALIALTEAGALRATGNATAARERLSRALEVFRASGDQTDLIATYEELSRADADLGDWRRAYQWQEAAKTTSEQLLRSQVDQHLAALKVEFDNVTREKEYDVLLRESQANSRALELSLRAHNLEYLVFGLVVVLAALLATLALHHNRNSRRLQKLALTDELTGVPNRRSVLSMLPEKLGNPARSTAVLIVDVDHFKRINDGFGHATGDRILKLVADRLGAALREPEFFGRIGGEEFLVVVPGADLATAQNRAEALRLEVSHCDIAALVPELASITVSIGIAISRPDDNTRTILQRADGALYRAKAAGRNRVHVELREGLVAVASGRSESPNRIDENAA